MSFLWDSAVWDVGVFLLVLAELVFVHELGHFVAAKLCGVYCERFSIGMPPRLFGMRLGETDYCIGALPLGGYVKMAGQEDVPKTEEERKEEYGHIPPERWLVNRPRWQRALVFVAGPAMNLVLGVFLYALVAAFGAEVPEAKIDSRIGQIEPGSPAETAPLYRVSGEVDATDLSGNPACEGWKTGDRILRINGDRVTNIQDVAVAAALGGGRPALVEIERTNDDGAVVRYLSPVAPAYMNNEDTPRFGVAPFSTALVTEVFSGGPAEEAGVQAGDVIARAGGQLVDTYVFLDMLSKNAGAEPVSLEVERAGQRLKLGMTPKPAGRIAGISFEPPLAWYLYLGKDDTLTVSHEDRAYLDALGLARDDVITSVEGQAATPALLRQLFEESPSRVVTVAVTRPKGWFGLREAIAFETALPVEAIVQAVTVFDIGAAPVVSGIAQEVAEQTGLQRKDTIAEINGEPATIVALRRIEEGRLGETIALTVRRPRILFGLAQQEEQRTASLAVSSVGEIGVSLGVRTVFNQVPLPQVLPEAFRRGYEAFSMTVKTVYLLVTGGLSMSNVGGPVMIFTVTTEAARRGLSWLLEMTALISVNLCVFNLLPLPVLDGGHLVLLGVEGIRRKPLDTRIVERVQQVGLVFIVGLFLFITVNDIKRLLLSMLP